MQNEMNEIDIKELNISFIATFSQGLFATLTFSTYLVHTPVLFELIQMSETEFSIGFVLFGLLNVLTNQLTARYLLPKLGSTNCLILARLMYSFIPFLIFYFSSYNIYILLSMCWGVAIGIQAPNIFTQVAIIEEKTKKILNPVFKSSFSIGFIIGGGISSICMGLEISPIYTTFFTGSFVFISTVTMFFYGLKKKYDIKNNNPRFMLPNIKIITFASINMFIFACMGIIVQWSPLWLVRDLFAPLYMVGSIVILFNVGEIVSNLLGSKLIKRFNEKIVGPYFAMLGSIILFLSVVSQNIYIIYLAVFIFGFLISNVMPIVYRQSVKHSQLPIPVTISHVSSIAFTGVIFGPALVGLSAETFGLTFNMYLLGIIMFAISILMLLIMQNSEQDRNTKTTLI
mgnify:FL=1